MMSAVLAYQGSWAWTAAVPAYRHSAQHGPCSQQHATAHSTATAHSGAVRSSQCQARHPDTALLKAPLQQRCSPRNHWSNRAVPTEADRPSALWSMPVPEPTVNLTALPSGVTAPASQTAHVQRRVVRSAARPAWAGARAARTHVLSPGRPASMHERRTHTLTRRGPECMLRTACPLRGRGGRRVQAEAVPAKRVATRHRDTSVGMRHQAHCCRLAGEGSQLPAHSTGAATSRASGAGTGSPRG